MADNAYTKFHNSITYSKANLSEIVVSYIKNKILAGELKSGDKLIETDISEELQISRAPVREGFRELNMQGILFFSPRKGSQILDMTIEDITEIFSIRIPLEMQVLTIIFESTKLEEEDLLYLEKINDDMLAQDNSMLSDTEKLYILNINDLHFHKFFWTKSGSLRRAHILENQFFQLVTAMNQDIASLGSTKEKYEEHRKIIESCRTGSLEQILKDFKYHMDSYLEAVSRF